MDDRHGISSDVIKVLLCSAACKYSCHLRILTFEVNTTANVRKMISQKCFVGPWIDLGICVTLEYKNCLVKDVYKSIRNTANNIVRSKIVLVLSIDAFILNLHPMISIRSVSEVYVSFFAFRFVRVIDRYPKMNYVILYLHYN